MSIQTQIEILSKIDHPNIVKLYQVYDDGEQIYLVLQIMRGGQLFDRIVQKQHYSEKQACQVIMPIVDAVRYCHKMGIAHRDLKPQNLLYSSKQPQAIIKVSDFGVSRVNSDMNEVMTTAIGTPAYIAPQILSGKGYSMKVDYWSIGVILYVLLCGYSPFQEQNKNLLNKQIKQGVIEFPEEEWNKISAEAKDLIRNLLQVEPKKRFGAQELLKHPWVKSSIKKDINLVGVPEKIQSYNARRRLKRVGLTVLFSTHFRKKIK